MTLILTLISNQGIVHASDSNLTGEDDRTLDRPGTKVFEAPSLRAGVAVAGSYSVSGVCMGKWMPEQIERYSKDASGTVAGFAASLRRSLDANMTTREKQLGCSVHVAGYMHEEDGWHPEMYILSNVLDLDWNGNYLAPQQSFRPFQEEFWSRACGSPLARAEFEAGRFLFYINGYPAGRMAYVGLKNELENFFYSLWNREGWLFRQPRTLDDYATYLGMHLSVIGDLFKMSDYPGQFIGGKTQIVPIPRPIT